MGTAPRKLLLVSTAAQDIDADLELSQIRRGVQRTRFRDQLELVVEHCVSLDELGLLLLHHRPQLLHLSGHGSTNGGLAFPTAGGGQRAVDFVSLWPLLAPFPELRYLVFNGCDTARLAQSFAAQRDLAIGVEGQLDSTQALAFSTVFYSALADGGSFEHAFALGLALSDCENFQLHHHPQHQPHLLHLGSPPSKLPPSEVSRLLQLWLARCRELQASTHTEFIDEHTKLRRLDRGITGAGLALGAATLLAALLRPETQLVELITMLALCPLMRYSAPYRRMNERRSALEHAHQQSTRMCVELERVIYQTPNRESVDERTLEQLAARLEALAGTPLLLEHSERVLLGPWRSPGDAREQIP